MYNQEDFLMLSELQHYAYCKRQWGLIHIEQQWEENERTVDGRIFHKVRKRRHKHLRLRRSLAAVSCGIQKRRAEKIRCR